MADQVKMKLMTIEAVAEVLSCSERHVYNLIIEGKIEAVKIGGRAYRVAETALAEFVEKNRVNPEDFYDPDKENTKEIKKETPVVAKSRWMDKS